jgi:hypothetical protein
MDRLGFVSGKKHLVASVSAESSSSRQVTSFTFTSIAGDTLSLQDFFGRDVRFVDLVKRCAAALGMPVSTTHAITTSIMGVGCARRWSALKLSVVARILVAWVLPLPLAAGMAWLVMKGCLVFGGVK